VAALERLGDYALERVLGQWTIATVYQARQGIASDPCALKVLKPDFFRIRCTVRISVQEPPSLNSFSGAVFAKG
jgi:hypothetical protein